MKKILWVILAAVIFAALLGSCARSKPAAASGERAAAAAKKYTIAISYQGPNNDWAINFKAHFEMTFAKYADQIQRVIYKEYGWDEAQQIADVEDIMLMGVDLLIIAPNSDTGLASSIENVKAAGIPVVVYNVHPGTEKYDALIKSDNIEDGRVEAAWMCERLGGKGNILIMVGAPGSAYADDIMAGYNKALAGFPDMKILGYEYAFWTPALAKEITESYFAKGDKIDGIIVSGLMGLGCLEAFLDAGMPIPPMTSGDGWTGFLRKAKDVGYTDFGAIPTNNFLYAVGAVDLAFDVLNGRPVQRNTFVPPNPVMSAQQMLGMLTNDMPESYWIGGIVPVADFNRYIR